MLLIITIESIFVQTVSPVDPPQYAVYDGEAFMLRESSAAILIALPDHAIVDHRDILLPAAVHLTTRVEAVHATSHRKYTVRRS